MAQGKTRTGTVIAWVCFGVALFIGGIGAEGAGGTLVRVANGIVVLGFLILVWQTLSRMARQKPAALATRLILYGGVALLFGYFTWRYSATLPIYEFAGEILDEL